MVDKPFRDPDRLEWEGITLADKLMIVSQLAQLVNYVAAECLRSKESRLAEGEFGASEEGELFAAVVGFALVAVQAAGMIYAYRHDHAKETSTATEQEAEWAAAAAGNTETGTEFENPVAADGQSDAI